MILEGGISKDYTQNWDKNGNIYYTDENGQVVDFKINPFTKLANKAKATAINIGNWLNETNPNSEAYKQKVSAIVGLETLPLGLGRFATQGIARGLTPYVGRKIAQNMAQGIGSGVVGGAIGGGAEAGLNDRNIAIGGLQGAITGGLLGGLGGYGLGKVAQKLNTQTAWHGSPYKFDKFSNEAIGTGEGAQAHGYGHYAAKNKDVAQGYAKNLSEGNKIIEYKGVPYKSVDEFKPNEYNYKLLADVKNDGLEATRRGLQEERQWALGKLEKTQDKGWWQDYLQEIDRKENLLNDLNPNLLSDITPDTGNLYKLSIPKDDVMLREGATFAEQPIKVQKALTDIQNDEIRKSGFNSIEEVRDRLNTVADEYEKAIREQAAPFWAWGSTPVSDYQLELSKLERLNNMFDYGGSHKNIYTNLAKRLGEEETSSLFNQHGIKGISYNGGIDGEANVIFNPDDIDIIPYYDNPTSLKEKFINLLNR